MQLIPPLVSPVPRKLISANPGSCVILNKFPRPKTHNWAQAHKVLMFMHTFTKPKNDRSEESRRN